MKIQPVYCMKLLNVFRLLAVLYIQCTLHPLYSIKLPPVSSMTQLLEGPYPDGISTDNTARVRSQPAGMIYSLF